MFDFLLSKKATHFRNRYHIAKKIFWLVTVLSLAPLLFLPLYALVNNSLQNSSQLSYNPTFFSSTWLVFGITTAIITVIVAIVDYSIRRELSIPLFGIILFVAALLDFYFLLILNKRVLAPMPSVNVCLSWAANQLYYVFAILAGTIVYVKIKARKIRISSQKNRIIKYTLLLITLGGVGCIIFISTFNSSAINHSTSLSTIVKDTCAGLSIALILFWAIRYLPTFTLRFPSIFSKIIGLVAFPLLLAQLLFLASNSPYDAYFIVGQYLKFVSYLVPLIGIVLNYVETLRNEQKNISKLDLEIKGNKKLMADLAAREGLLAKAEQISKLGSWIYNIKQGSYTWSNELYNIYGVAKNEDPITNELISKIILPEHLQKIEKELATAIKNKSHFAVEYVICKPGNVKRYILNQGYFSEANYSLVGTVQDITELKEATLKLKRSEMLLSEGEAVAHSGSWEWFANSEVIFWSDEMFNIHGHLPHSTIPTLSTYLAQVYTPNKFSFLRMVVLAKRKEETLALSYQIVRPNGELRFLTTTAKLKKDELGGQYTYLGNTQDVTELKEAQRKLEEKVTELNRSNKELEQFAYVASHDLQEPIRKIRAFGERLQHKFSDNIPNEGQDYIERMRNAAERMQILIEDLLSFSKLSTEVSDMEPVNLSNLITKCLVNLELTIEEKNAKIINSVNQEIDGIETQLFQLFQNLLSNALKFVKPDVSPVIVITGQVVLGKNLPIIGANANQNYFVVKIEDNGIGFEEAFVHKIFELFKRLHTRSEYPGTGIGLAICKKIVDNHNGFIFAESIEGVGATFYVALPLNHHSL